MKRVYITEEIMKLFGLNGSQWVWVLIVVFVLIAVVACILDKGKRESENHAQSPDSRSNASGGMMMPPPMIRQEPQTQAANDQAGETLDVQMAKKLINDESLKNTVINTGSLLRFRASNAGMTSWRVLEVKEGKALLFCVDDMKPASLAGAEPVCWAESECRRVMAELLADFPEALREAVLPTTCSNSIFRDGKVEADEPTTDYLFALSKEEAEYYYRTVGLVYRPDVKGWSCVARSASNSSGSEVDVLRMNGIPLGATGMITYFLQTSKAAADCSKPTHPAMWVDVDRLLKACAG